MHDSNALVLLGARFFDPGSGVFVSVDPLLDPGNPAQFNAYVYAGNNPATWSDPSGLAWTGPVADGGDHRYTWKGKTGTGKTKPTAGSLTQAATAGTSNGVVPRRAAPGCGASYYLQACGSTSSRPQISAEQWAGIGAVALGVAAVVAGLACIAATAGICGAGIAVGWGGGVALAGGGAVMSGTIVVSGTAIGGTAVAVGGAAAAGGIGVLFNESSGASGGGPKPGGGYGRGGQRLKPDPEAGGYPHSTFRRGADGKINHYVEWTPNPRNMNTGYDVVKRFDLTGEHHWDKLTGRYVDTPHVQWPRGRVTPAEFWEIP